MNAKNRFGAELYIESGCLFASRTPITASTVAQLLQSGVKTRVLETTEIAEIMGHEFAKEFPFGYFNPETGYAIASLTVKYVEILAKEAGVNFVIGSQAGAFAEYLYNDDSKQTVTGIVTADGTKHYGDWVLMAAGSWTPSLVPQLDGLCTVSGQPVIHFKLPNSLKPRFQDLRFPIWFADVTATGFYGFPISQTMHELKISNHGRLAVVSSMHKNRKPKINAISTSTPLSIPKKAIQEYRRFFERVFPELNQLDISRTRLCWYCESWDGNFYIDAVPGVKNLFVATGGSGHGFKFVPVLGDVIADIMEGKEEKEVRDLFGWRTSGLSTELDAIQMRKMDVIPVVLENVELATFNDLAATTIKTKL
ncbi:UNVERIFIED_CONTAM: hypothetical protein HDU68_007887 [Siphonaria sp. JEL0065]|nr:hypothetical protein HDU68_007887 [Siphonaria sp. JEL0065]